MRRRTECPSVYSLRRRVILYRRRVITKEQAVTPVLDPTLRCEAKVEVLSTGTWNHGRSETLTDVTPNNSVSPDNGVEANSKALHGYPKSEHANTDIPRLEHSRRERIEDNEACNIICNRN